MLKNFKKIISLVLSIFVIASSMTMLTSAESYFDESEIKAAFDEYVLENGNDSTAQGLEAALEKALDADFTVADGDFYIKYAVEGAYDEDDNPQTRINIPGKDGAVAAIVSVDGEQYGFTSVIKHTDENLGKLYVTGLGTYPDPADSSRVIINWVGNGDVNARYKIVMPENASYINVDGTTFAGGTKDNIVAIVMLGHRASIPVYNMFPNLEAVVMADSITGQDTASMIFFQCSKLKYVHMSEGWNTTIKWASFAQCSSLVNINIPSTVTGIEDLAFQLTALREITKPAGAWEETNAFASPEGDAANGRHINNYGEQMPLLKAAAYVACNAENTDFDSETDTADTLKSKLLSGVNLASGVSADWDDFGYESGDRTLKEDFIVTDGSKSITIPYKKVLSGLKKEEIKAAFDEYVSENGNDATAEGLQNYLSQELEATVQIADGDFYIKYAVEGAYDEDDNPQTRINIPGKDGAISAIVTVNGQQYGFATPIKHTDENLGKLYVAPLGTYPDGSGDVVNWVGNYEVSARYKIVLPESASYINVDGTTFAGGTKDNIVAIVMLGHRASIERLPAFSSLEAVVMSDNITDQGGANTTFQGCSKLKYVHMSEGWNSTILWGTFVGCSSLVNINIPQGVVGFEDCSFQNTALREITKPANAWLQNDPFASPAGDAANGRNISNYGEQMPLLKAAAYVAANTGKIEFNSSKTADSLKSEILSGINFAAGVSADWKGFNYQIGDNKINEILNVTSGSDVIEISYSRDLSDDSKLKSLSLSGLELNPSFDPDITEYSISVLNNINSLELVATPDNEKASLGEIVNESALNNLPVGITVIEIPVTAQNGNTTVYKVSVTRGAAVDETVLADIENKFNSYVEKVGNDATATELTQYINNSIGKYTVALPDENENFYIYHAVDGVFDLDSVSEDKISIPGHDGYVSAQFAVKDSNNQIITYVSFVKSIPHLEENLGTLKKDVYSSDNANFVTDNDVITGYVGNAQKLVFPKDIQIASSMKDSIGMAGVKAVVFTGVPAISNAAFNGTALCAVQFNSRFSVIGEYAFANCTNLKYVGLNNCGWVGSERPYLQYGAFSGCSKLQNCNMPTVAHVYGCAFAGTALRYIEYNTEGFAFLFDPGHDSGNPGSYNYAFANPSVGGTRVIINKNENATIGFANAVVLAQKKADEVAFNDNTAMDALKSEIVSAYSSEKLSTSLIANWVESDFVKNGTLTTATLALSNGTVSSNVKFVRTAMGDINVNGVINASDIVHIRKVLLGVNTFTSKYEDVNNDGVISLLDLVKIKKIAAEGFDVSTKTDVNALATARLTSVNNAADSLDLTDKKVYYVSANGNDSADGLTPQTAWKTIDLEKGSDADAILFERGGEYTIPDHFALKSGTTYAAYGTGAKPVITNSINANSGWTQDSSNIWKKTISASDRNDVGNIIFNNGASCGTLKDSKAALAAEGDFCSDNGSLNCTVYLYSQGNPTTVYDDIKLCMDQSIFTIGSGTQNVTVDNLALKYTGAHAIWSDNGNQNITVTNCEIAWIGGSILDDSSQRYGNGIEFWMGIKDTIVENCYIHDIYDSGISHQGTDTYRVENLTLKDNLIVNCGLASIEYWHNEYNKSFLENVVYTGNISRNPGYGFGGRENSGRHITTYPDNANNATNFKVINNVFDNARTAMFGIYSNMREWATYPIFQDNVYSQVSGSQIGDFAGKQSIAFNDVAAAKAFIGDKLGEYIFK